jgi:chaperonin GroEL (HSP60 family)
LTSAYKVIELKDQQIGLLNQKDSLKNQKINNLEVIITKKDQQFDLEREKSESLLKELKGQKLKTFFYKMGSGIALITTVLYIAK